MKLICVCVCVCVCVRLLRVCACVCQEHELVADTLAEAMGLVKIGPADMDSITRNAFADRTKVRLKQLEENLAAIGASSRASRKAREAKAGGGGADLLEDSQDMHAAEGDTVMLEENPEELARELLAMQQELVRQQEFLQEVDDVERNYAETPAPVKKEVPGGYVLPPPFPDRREIPFDIKLPAPDLEQKEKGHANPAQVFGT